MENSSTSVIVKLELGHQAFLRSHPTQDGFTHDWTVFVRGIEGSNIHHFIEKVVFYLHESFPKPKRVVKEPPYQVSESGYAGFIMPIEVYFKNKEEPKKVKFEYDLYLRLEGPPVNHVRYEKLTFQNPVDDFRRKLLKAGGIGSAINSNGGNTATVQTHSTSGHGKSDNSIDNQKLTVTKVSSFHGQEKKKQHSTTKELKNQTAIAKISQPFTDIFGTPIKTKPSPDQTGKSKECSATHQNSQKASTGHKSVKVSTNSHSSSSNGCQNSSKESKSSRSSKDKTPSEKETKEQKLSKTIKHSEKESKSSGVKRYSSPTSGQNCDGTSVKKRPRSASTSSENSSVLSTAGEKKEVKIKNKEGKIKDKHKPKTEEEGKSSGKKERSKEKKVSKHKKTSDQDKILSPHHSDQQKIVSKESIVKEPDHTPSYPTVENRENLENIQPEEANSSPSSSLSLSPGPPGGSHGPLATMMAEMEKDLLSPLSSDPGSPVQSHSSEKSESHQPNGGTRSDCAVQEIETPTKVKKEETKKSETEKINKIKKDSERVKVKKEDAENRNKKENSAKHTVKKEKNVEGKSEERDEKKQSLHIESSYLKELIDLQQQIMSLRDRHLLQKIVDVIEETGQYNISRSSFDFDLCLLDQTTVRKLQNCLIVK